MDSRYFDHNATTPVRDEIQESIASATRNAWANPSSLHKPGVEARYALEKSRRRLARILDVETADDLVFTSGGSESIALALRGVAFAARRQGRGAHLVVSATEHAAVLETACSLRDQHGFTLTIVPVNDEGRVDPESLKEHLRRDTILVSIILANNETGSINDIPTIRRVVGNHSTALLHTDAIQALGRIPLSIQKLGADLVSLNAHKSYGPRGIGLLYRHPGVGIEPLVIGGGQEGGLRAGTENPPLAVGFAETAELATRELASESIRLKSLREILWERITAAIPDARRNSPGEQSLPQTLNVSIPGCASRQLVRELDHEGFSVSSGSACMSAAGQPSHVLLSMGIPATMAASAIRISLGRCTTDSSVGELSECLARVTNRLRGI